MIKILKFKNWQLFILIVLNSAFTGPSPLQEIIRCIGLMFFLIWIYAIGVYGQRKLESLKLPNLKTGLFKINILLLPVLLTILGLTIPNEKEHEIQLEFNFQLLTQVLCSLYFFFAFFQTIIFSAKTITMLELKRDVKLSDYILNLVYTIFLLVGIWFLQTKISRLITVNEDDNK